MFIDGENMAIPLVSGVLLLIEAVLVAYIIFRLGKVLFGLLTNMVLGFISLFAINLVFGVGIPYDLAAVAITAIFGVFGVIVLVLLSLFGITL
jgi:hypothetical protein